MTPRLVWTTVAAAASALAVVLTIAVAELPSRHAQSPTGAEATQLTPARMRALLAGSPPALAALHAQGGTLLEGGAKAWAAQLQALEGWPLVVNKWASWCVPCQQERGVFQRAAARTGRRVAFLGLDSADPSRSQAQMFLKATPMSYPSLYDPGGELGRKVTDSSFTPVTVIVSPRGGRYIHQGPYETAAELERDIARYGHAAAGA